jgi:hypothetical protein
LSYWQACAVAVRPDFLARNVALDDLLWRLITRLAVVGHPYDCITVDSASNNVRCKWRDADAACNGYSLIDEGEVLGSEFAGIWLVASKSVHCTDERLGVPDQLRSDLLSNGLALVVGYQAYFFGSIKHTSEFARYPATLH